MVLGYPDVFAAADAVPGLLEHPLLGLEGLDRTLVDHMRARPLNVQHLALLPEGHAWLYAELGGDSPAEADEATSPFSAALAPGQVWRRFDDVSTGAAVARPRVGARRDRHPGGRRPQPRGPWQDAACRPCAWASTCVR